MVAGVAEAADHAAFAERQCVSASVRLSRIRPYLACPKCHGDLVDESDHLRCGKCASRYPLRSGKIYFADSLKSKDSFDSVKGRLKRLLGRLYYQVGVPILGPSFPFNYRRKIFSFVDPQKAVVVDLGAGNHRVSEDIVTLDGVDYEEVDIVADLTALPFKSNSIHCFCSRSVLEHVPDMYQAIDDIKRCTERGGVNIHFIPFLFPYHASPDDYHRLTHTGVAALFREWVMVEQKNTCGPVSLLLLIIIEWLSTLLALGSERAKPYTYLFLCLCLFPLKFLDWPFVGRRRMLTLAPTIVSVMRKP